MSIGLDHDLEKTYMDTNYTRVVSNYTSGKSINEDIAVLQLESPFVLGNETNIYPACLLTALGGLRKYAKLLQGKSNSSFH